MIELGIIKKEFLDMFNEVVSEIYFQGPVEPEKIEPDPSRAEDAAYQEEVKKMQEEAEKKAQDENAFNEKIKKKIKISIIKPEVFKKKRDNIGAFITVEPNPYDKGIVQEIEEIPISKRETEKKPEEENGEENKEEKKEEEEKKENEQTNEGGENPEAQNQQNTENKEEKKEEEKKEGEPENKENNENANGENAQQPPQEGQSANKEEEQVKEESKFIIYLYLFYFLLL